MSKLNNINKDLMKNIEITDEMKNEIYRNCSKGRRTGDLRFKYAGALTALIIFLTVGFFGISVKAFYETVKSRMENMPAEEHDNMLSDLNSDTGIKISDAWSRPLSDSEISRLAELEREYYSLNVFPEYEVSRADKLTDWYGNSVCYIEEDHLLHLPSAEMTDEQLLQFIDYNAKKDYVMEKQAQEIFEDPEYDDFVTPYVDVDSATEQDIIDLGYVYLKRQFGVDLSSEWIANISAFKPSGSDPEAENYHDMYTITWTKGTETPNGTRYVVVLGMHELEFRVAAVDGKEYWAQLGSITRKEAEKKAVTDEPKVLSELKRLYDYSVKPDSVRYDATVDYGDSEDTRQVYYIFMYGEVEVCVTWNIVDETVASVEIYDYSKE